MCSNGSCRSGQRSSRANCGKVHGADLTWCTVSALTATYINKKTGRPAVGTYREPSDDGPFEGIIYTYLKGGRRSGPVFFVAKEDYITFHRKFRFTTGAEERRLNLHHDNVAAPPRGRGVAA